jgi:hypothetical protein
LLVAVAGLPLHKAGANSNEQGALGSRPQALGIFCVTKRLAEIALPQQRTRSLA